MKQYLLNNEGTEKDAFGHNLIENIVVADLFLKGFPGTVSGCDHLISAFSQGCFIFTFSVCTSFLA